MLSPEEKVSFLAAIAAQPDDRLPRLVYADRLEEDGQQERAEFIRVMIEWEAKKGGPGSALMSRRLRRLAKAFLPADHEIAYCSYVNENYHFVTMPLRRESGEAYHWRDGFIEHAICPLESWLYPACTTCRWTIVNGIRTFVPETVLPRFVVDLVGRAVGCEGCGGTGSPPGVRDTIFSEHPVASVDITLVGEFVGGGRPEYFWRTDAIFDHECLPDVECPNGSYEYSYIAFEAFNSHQLYRGRKLAGYPAFLCEPGATVSNFQSAGN